MDQVASRHCITSSNTCNIPYAECQCNSVAALCYTSYSTPSRPKLEGYFNRAKRTQHFGGIAQAGLSPHDDRAELRSNCVGMPVHTQLQSGTPVCHAPHLLILHMSGLQPVSVANMRDVHTQFKDICVWYPPQGTLCTVTALTQAYKLLY